MLSRGAGWPVGHDPVGSTSSEKNDGCDPSDDSPDRAGVHCLECGAMDTAT